MAATKPGSDQKEAEPSYASARAVSGVIVLLGCWLIVSPFIFAYFTHPDAALNSIVVGAVIILIASSRMATPKRSLGSTGLNLLLGCWIIASPWVWDYAHMSTARWDCVATGIAIAVLAAASGGATRRQAQRLHGPTQPAAH